MTRKKALLTGMKNAFPIVMGYIPIGMTYGILAAQTGVSTIITVALSVIVYAGSAQLICINMLEQGAAVIPIIMMTFLVNLRHLLMSASLSLHLKTASKRMLPLLGFLITDESFAVAGAAINKKEYKEFFFLGLGLTAYLSWITSSWIGVTLGKLMPGINSPALDFVLPAMFVALLVMQINRKVEIIIAGLSGILSLVFVYILPANWNIIAATVIAATLGVLWERWS